MNEGCEKKRSGAAPGERDLGSMVSLTKSPGSARNPSLLFAQKVSRTLASAASLTKGACVRLAGQAWSMCEVWCQTKA